MTPDTTLSATVFGALLCALWGAVFFCWLFSGTGGDESAVRLVKTSRAGNVMEDSTFTYHETAGSWSRLDNVSRLSETLEVQDCLSDGGSKIETRTLRDANGAFLGSTTVETGLVGECDNAVLRERGVSENTGNAVHWRQAEWWDDPSTGRHGKLRLLQFGDRPWEWHDYDAQGRETLRLEQRNGSPPPASFEFADIGIGNTGTGNISTLATFPDAFVTVFGYETLDGDSAHPDDALRPRSETRYVVQDGVSTLISRSWHRYTRFASPSNPANPVEKHETWRASSQAASSFSDPSNARSCTISLDTAAEGVPLVARGREIESLDEDGVLSITTVSQTAGRVVFETRKSLGGVPFPTYEVEEVDATHGTVLRASTRMTATDALIADEINVYDEKNRLRSTTYLDGTSATNAYSCCRLLSSTGRDGRTVLRSARTGTEQGAGGVGGLLAVMLSENAAPNLSTFQPFNLSTSQLYIPLYDYNGNIVRYISEDGSTSAAYVYDPFGSVLESSGPLADDFTFQAPRPRNRPRRLPAPLPFPLPRPLPQPRPDRRIRRQKPVCHLPEWNCIPE